MGASNAFVSQMDIKVCHFGRAAEALNAPLKGPTPHSNGALSEQKPQGERSPLLELPT